MCTLDRLISWLLLEEAYVYSCWVAKKRASERERERRGDKGAFRPPPLPPFSVNPARITRVEIPVRAWLFNLDFSTLCFCFRKKRGREKEREN